MSDQSCTLMKTVMIACPEFVTLPLSGVGPVIRQRLIQREGAISITPTYLAQERERKYTRVPCVSET